MGIYGNFITGTQPYYTLCQIDTLINESTYKQSGKLPLACLLCLFASVLEIPHWVCCRVAAPQGCEFLDRLS